MDCRRILLLAAPLMLIGCMQRELVVQSDPPGAIVSLNDREVGRTPFKKTFLWYGNYDVVVRKDGYRTLKTTDEVTAPFWQWVPFDLLTDFLPLHDEEEMHFSLKPDTPSDPVALMANGQQMKDQLASSEFTVHKNVLNVHPAPRPSTQPLLEHGAD
jgi:hypothetical protein